MKKKFKTTGIGKKVIPATAALGILFSMAPIAENKASAGIGTILDVTITSLGIVKDIYEGLGISPNDPGPGTRIDEYAENITYRAPNFTSGEFNISMHHTADDSNFTKSVKVLYPNGKIEIYKLRSGQQLKITEAGTIIDLNPDAKSVSEHDLLYITQAQLDEGKTGVVMNQGQTAFVEKTSGKNPRLVIPFHKKRYPSYTSEWSFARGTDALFDELSEEEKRISTLTSKPVSKDVLWNYLTSDSKALADFHDRSASMFADTNLIFKTPIVVSHVGLNSDTPFQIIPCEKGSKKVILKTGSKYLSGKEGESLQYSDSIGDNEIFELVQIENNTNNEFQFHLINKNGAYLAFTGKSKLFSTNTKDNIRFIGKSNNEINNWLREWYPGKENEKQKYDGIEITIDEKDPTKWSAKDSSGNVIKNSWVNRGDQYFFADADGIFMTGWQDIEGKRYYFKEGIGLINTNGYNMDGKYYNFNDDGSVKCSTWTEDQHNLHYSDASGALVEKGPQEIDGKIYYFQNYNVNKKEIRLEDQNRIIHVSDKGAFERVSDLDGKVLDYRGMLWLDNKQIAFTKDGSILNPGISKVMERTIDGNEEAVLKYYSLEEGTGYYGWKVINGKNYHFSDGSHYTFNGYENIDGKKYYFHEDGSANRVGFEKIDGKIYYFNNDGVAQKGWQTIDNKYYYFDENGAAKTGLFQVGGGYRPIPLAYGYLWYCAREDGSLYADGWFKIDGKDYHFDKWGHKMPY